MRSAQGSLRFCRVVANTTLQPCVHIGGSAAGLAARVVVPFFKKGDWSVCYKYRGITLLSLPSKLYLGYWRGGSAGQSNLGFRRSNVVCVPDVERFYTLSRVFEGCVEV